MDELAKRFADLAEKYGPKVADAALAAARMEAYSTIAAALMWSVFVVGLIYLGRRLWNMKGGGVDADMAHAGAIALWFISAVAGTFVVWTFVDPWTWTTISNPELWIAKKAFKL